MTRNGLIPLTLFVVVALFPWLIAQPVIGQTDKNEPAAYVFRNGPVYTVDDKQPWAQAVAVRGNRIVYVGNNAGVIKHIGANTDVIDLKGKMLMPGFVEAHIHPLVGSCYTKGIVLHDEAVRKALLKSLRSYSKTIGKGRNLVRGYGWGYNAFPDTGPSKEDRITSVFDASVVVRS